MEIDFLTLSPRISHLIRISLKLHAEEAQLNAENNKAEFGLTREHRSLVCAQQQAVRGDFPVNEWTA